jgi:ABC-2 type transport system ATP-binding protein
VSSPEGIPAIQFLDVWQVFRDQGEVLRGVNLTVERGVILGLLGPSGAGKTTLLRLLAGLLEPTRGEVRVAGHQPAGNAGHARDVGCVIRNFSSFRPRLTGRENLLFFTALFGMSANAGTRRCDDLLADTGLTAVADRRYSSYTDGMRQRLFMARALIPDPEVLVLDEPTGGLSPTERSDFYGFLVDHIRERGCTVLYATHDLNEAQFLCDEVALLDRGKIVAQGSYLGVRADAARVFARTQLAGAAPTYPGVVAARELAGRARRDRW